MARNRVDGEEVASESVGIPISYPPNPNKDAHTKFLRSKWRDQRRVKCADPKCCYPLNLLKTTTGERIQVVVPEGDEFEGQKAYKAECSWDPRHKRPNSADQYVTHQQLFPPDDKVDLD